MLNHLTVPLDITDHSQSFRSLGIASEMALRYPLGNIVETREAANADLPQIMGASPRL
jgi:hypothetical protein